MKICLAIPTSHEVDNTFWKLIKSQYNVDLLLTGVGIANTTFRLTQYLLKNTTDFIIHAGIAGSFSEHLVIGQVTQVVKDAFADFGVDEGNQFIHATNIFNEPLWYENTAMSGLSLPTVTGITVNAITASAEKLLFYKNHYRADIETMENVAVFMISQQLKIPFIAIRAISNQVGERNKQNWDINTAVKNLWLNLNNVLGLLYE